MLTKIFGTCSQVKLIDFLVAHPWSEFSKTELAEGAQIARPTVYKLLDKLLAENILIKTKKVGNIQLYHTNRNSPVIKHISSLQGLLADMELEENKKSFKEEPVELTDEKIDEMLELDNKEKSVTDNPNESDISPEFAGKIKTPEKEPNVKIKDFKKHFSSDNPG